MEHEVTSKQFLLNYAGRISEPGWARTPVWTYNRTNIRAPLIRTKEWDYYLFNTDTFAVAFTISDLGYIGLLSVSYIDLVNAVEHTESEMIMLPLGKRFGLGTSAEDAHARGKTKRLKMSFENTASGRRIRCLVEVLENASDTAARGKTKRLKMSFENTASGRRIRCIFKNFNKADGSSFKADLLIKNPDSEAMYIATPWKEKPTAFYYNCKMNCLTAEGTIECGGIRHKVTHETCAGVLDWGRGVWTYDNTWYWGTGSGRLNGEPFGFNLGYGFSDRSCASENGIFYKGRIHKLENVTFDIPVGSDGKREYLKEWTINSSDGRFKSVFKPILDRKSFMDFKIISSDQHQVFGRLTGSFVTDGGETLEFRDFVCALEVVRNKY